MTVVEIENVTKTFRQHVAVNRLSLSVPRGFIYGFIGPNGSGKTTTLRMIMRIYHPDPGPGVVRVLGEANSAAANDRVGYLPEERGLYKKMTVREVLRFYAELKGRRDAAALIPPWLDKMGLADWTDKTVESLSRGMAQKVQFISAVIAKPELVILDEPFSGLDPVNADILREVVLELRKTGTTVIFSTHDMSVAEKMCDFIFMIYRGNKVLDGTLESIQDRYGSDTIRVRMEGDGFDPRTIPGVEKVTDFGRLQELRMAANRSAGRSRRTHQAWTCHALRADAAFLARHLRADRQPRRSRHDATCGERSDRPCVRQFLSLFETTKRR